MNLSARGDPPAKVRVATPIVEMDGDEMARVMWQLIKDRLILPYLDVMPDYYDLGLPHRDQTEDRVTVEAAEAIKRYGVGVKCATITPNKDRVREYDLKQEWASPNATIRGVLDGTVFRSPIMVKNVLPGVRSWRKPIHIGRHAYGDVYKNREFRVPGAGRAELVFTDAAGEETFRGLIKEFDGPGVIQGLYNTDASIASFARACFTYAYDRRLHLWFGAKDTISKIYDARFRALFDQEYAANWKQKFEATGLDYFFTLIDDAVARIMKTEGGVLWACKNYDGDVMSDMVASAYGSLAMMTSVLVSPEGYYEFEAAHGTVQKHYYRHQRGERTSTNPMASIFAWTGALRKRGELDGTPRVVEFAETLERAALDTVESGIMTGDLLAVAVPDPSNTKVYTEEFIERIADRLSESV
jgi:isocitrate dehydrogenase